MFVLFDIGGTKTRLTVSKDGRTFIEPIVFHTEKDFNDELSKIKRIVNKISNGNDIKAIAGGVAGPLNEGRSRLLNSPNLPHWVGINLKEEIEHEFNAPVFLENDSAMVGLGESTYGAGAGHSIVAYITVSTGVGGARIVDGAIDRKKFGFEPGHQIINLDNSKCSTCSGACGHLEDLISGRSIEERYNIKPYEITDKNVWEKEAYLLAVGLNNVAVFWSPDCIVLGGSMILGSPCIDINTVENNLKNILKIFPTIPAIKKAKLGDFGGLYGSLIYLKQNIS